MGALIPTRTVHALAEAQNWRCCYCGVPMLSRHAGAEETHGVVGSGGRKWHRRMIARMHEVTAEHVVPRCDGGSDDAGNLVAAHRFCNEFRSNQPVDFALSRIRRMVRRGTHPFQAWARSRTYVGNCRLPSIHKSPRAPASRS